MHGVDMMNQKAIPTYHFGYSYVVAERAPAGWVRICAPRLSLVSGAVAGREGERSGSLSTRRPRAQLRQTPMNKSDHNGYWAALERSKLVRLGVRNRSQ